MKKEAPAFLRMLLFEVIICRLCASFRDVNILPRFLNYDERYNQC